MSTNVKVPKLDIATEYLNVAMQMYLGRQHYFCAVHLAAAAAELYDCHLPEEKRTSQIAWRAQKALHRYETGEEPTKKQINEVVNGSKNAIKHMNDGESSVTIDPTFEAKWHIDHALASVQKLGLRKTPTFWRYEDAENAEMRSGVT